MKNSQLTEVLTSLDKAEFKEFGKFARSPYFNNRNEVVRFYDALKKFYPKFSSKNLREELLFSSVYPKKKYNDVLMRKLVSLLVKHAMNYIAISGFKEAKLGYEVKLLYKLYDKNLPVMFEKESKSIEELLKNSIHTAEYYEAKFRHTSKLNAYLISRNEKAAIQEYQKELDDFIEYFLVVILILYQRLKTYSNIFNYKYDLKFFNEVMEFLSKNDYTGTILVSMYYYMILLSDMADEKYFFEFISFWEKNETRLSDLYQYNIYTSLYNYCLDKVKRGEIKYRKLLFDLSVKLLAKNIIVSAVGHISTPLFTGIVRNAVYLKEIKWAEEFITGNKQWLDPAESDECVEYSLAMLEFEKENFGKSMEHLSVLNPHKLIMKLNGKNLFIMNLYEMGYSEELLSAIDAYRHFLHRDKTITQQYINMNSLFLKYVSELSLLRVNGKNDENHALKKEIENTPYFTLKEWVVKKAEELSK